MAITLRSSRLAAVVESTEGTLIAPTGTGDYMAMQDDFSMTPATESIENAELKSSIGKAKSIVGVENPTASFSHYLRASGTVGTAPDFAELLQASLGAESIISTERDTVSSSTTTVIKVDAGEGAEFERGDILMIKDGTNGYSLRPVHSVSTDDLTLGFQLSAAPASGVNLGRSVLYKPADSGHQTLSMWHYAGNGGLVQAMTGSRVTSMQMTANTGELLNMQYTLEGNAYYYNPVIIASADRYIDWTENGNTKAASITAKAYKSPDDLASALQTAMQAQSAGTITVTYSDSTGKYTIAYTGVGLFTLPWNTGANTANTVGDKIGFSTAADDTGAITYTSDNALTLSSPHTPALDSSDPLVVKNMECFLGDQTSNTCFGASTVSMTLATPSTKIKDICAESGIDSSLINSREVTLSIVALIDQYDVDKFERYRNNTESRFLFNFGTKSGGNWVVNKCGHVYLPSCVISNFSVDQVDGVAVMNLELKAFVDSSGNGEVYIAFV